MWWNSSRTASVCSAVMALILATSRLTFCTSSSLSCCSSCALLASPSATSNMAAFRRLGSASASLVVFRIMAGTPAQASALFLPNPGAQDLHRNVRFLGDLLPQVFGKNFGLLDRKSTRLHSSHLVISCAVFCWKKCFLITSQRGREGTVCPAWPAAQGGDAR